MNLKDLELNSWQYEMSDRFFNFIGKIISPTWDSRLLGISNLKINTILDVGSNNGQFIKDITKIFPDANIYAFEPIPDAYNKLKKIVDKNERVKTFQLALGDEDKDLEINLHKMFSASSSFLPTTKISETKFPMTQQQEKILVKQKQLDNVLDVNSLALKKDILVKLDVQGYEDKVILGGKEILKKAKVCIVEVCIDELYEGQCSFKDIFFLLSELGYQYKGNIDQIMDKDGHILFLNSIFVKY